MDSSCGTIALHQRMCAHLHRFRLPDRKYFRQNCCKRKPNAAKNSMNKSPILTASLTTLLLLGLLFCPGNIAFAQNGNGNDDDDQQNSKLCSTQFEATVHSGPDKGLSLTGVLTLNEGEGSRVAGVLE